jgi:alpha-beta hydrolase superfamily lysophospholipase
MPHTGGMTPDTLATRDGLRLAVVEWPLAGARGTVVIAHGLGEHVGRYAHVAAYLNRQGWTVVGYDQRGHGRSEGERGRLAAADDLLSDLADVLDAVRAEPGFIAPLVLLGHSMGGTVAARFVAGGLELPRPPWWRPVDALVLSSPALDTGMTLVQKAMLAALGPLAPNLAVGNGLKPEWIARDPAVVAAYVADPLVHDRIAPRLARFMVDGGAAVRAMAPRWNVPTLLLYAGSDRCVAPAGSAAFAAAAPAGIVTASEFPALFHEIFNEPEQAEVLSVLGAWLDTLIVSPTRSKP